MDSYSKNGFPSLRAQQVDNTFLDEYIIDTSAIERHKKVYSWTKGTLPDLLLNGPLPKMDPYF